MKKTKIIHFAELQRLLKDLGFSQKQSETAWVFRHPKEGLLAFRLYKGEEPVDAGDLLSTRKFLDLRGLLDSEDFDALLQQTSTPA
jgi:hypothetical protein